MKKIFISITIIVFSVISHAAPISNQLATNQQCLGLLEVNTFYHRIARSCGFTVKDEKIDEASVICTKQLEEAGMMKEAKASMWLGVADFENEATRVGKEQACSKAFTAFRYHFK